jgi:hypothetical protein
VVCGSDAVMVSKKKKEPEMKNLNKLIVALSLIIVQSVFSVNWTSQWIWQAADGPGDTWMCFRKNFTLSQVPDSATAYIAADSKYWLYVNDVLVVLEGGLKRGTTIKDAYYDEVDLTPYLVLNCIS